MTVELLLFTFHVKLWFSCCCLMTCSGLVKPKKYDWKDSNLALFGSDTEKQVKSKQLCIVWFNDVKLVEQVL